MEISPGVTDHMIFEVRKADSNKTPCRLVASLAGGSRAFQSEAEARAAYKKAGIPYPVEETITVRGEKATACRGVEGVVLDASGGDEPLTDSFVSVRFQSEGQPVQVNVIHVYVTVLTEPLPNGSYVKLTTGAVPTVQEMADWIDTWTYTTG